MTERFCIMKCIFQNYRVVKRQSYERDRCAVVVDGIRGFSSKVRTYLQQTTAEEIHQAHLLQGGSYSSVRCLNVFHKIFILCYINIILLYVFPTAEGSIEIRASYRLPIWQMKM